MLVRFSESTDDRIATHKLESHGSLATANLDRDQQLIYHNELLFLFCSRGGRNETCWNFTDFLLSDGDLVKLGDPGGIWLGLSL